jgi:energy-coupling factor transporter ATP-binding protein EcfA2
MLAKYFGISFRKEVIQRVLTEQFQHQETLSLSVCGAIGELMGLKAQKPRILVLDEATSALDYTTEYQVCKNLKEAFHDTTVFFITHRLSTIQNSDIIIMMDAGTVVEQGNHQQLMTMGGCYYSLFNKQES